MTRGQLGRRSRLLGDVGELLFAFQAADFTLQGRQGTCQDGQFLVGLRVLGGRLAPAVGRRPVNAVELELVSTLPQPHDLLLGSDQLGSRPCQTVVEVVVLERLTLEIRSTV